LGECDTRADKNAYGVTLGVGGSPGAITLLGKHVRQLKCGVVLRFRGKKGVKLSIPVDDADTAAMLVERAQKAGPEGRLFPHVSPRTLRTYLRAIGGGMFRLNDFRILLAIRIARAEVEKMPVPKTEQEYKRAAKHVAQAVAEKLGITADLAIKSYIDPKVFWKWAKRWTDDDRWTPGPDGELLRIYPRPGFTRKEYAEMREESLRKQQDCEKEYDAEEAQQFRQQRKKRRPKPFSEAN
jgi:DNA topoisomerase IB